jgi:hypothetical protein
LRIGDELGPATGAAEMPVLSGMVRVVLCSGGIDRHSANRVADGVVLADYGGVVVMSVAMLVLRHFNRLLR